MANNKFGLAAYYLSRLLEDIVGWTTHPHPEPLTDGWLDKYRQNIHGTIGRMKDVCGKDATIQQQTRDAEILALELVTLLHSHPKLSQKPARKWTLKCHRVMVDELARLEKVFRDISNRE